MMMAAAAAKDKEPCSDCLMLREEFAKNPGGKSLSKTGVVLTVAVGGAAAALTALCVPFVTPAMRRACLPYVPATEQQVANVLAAIKSSKGATLVDVGSGDGRVVLAAAKNGLRAHGVELNLWLVLYSR